MSDRKTVIIGCGPAGLAAGYELSKRNEKVVCIEQDSIVGGITKTLTHNGFRFDIGGHRFFTKLDRVNKLWHDVLPDDFLNRPRLSRIYYKNKFFNYPLKPLNALAGLGLIDSFSILASYLKARVKPYPNENTFEQWVTNRFGKKLYQTFFKTYTEKVWGISCSEIQAEWAAQRIKGLSLTSAVKTAIFGDRNKNIKTLIGEFEYPRLGPGQMYEAMAKRITELGGKVLMNTSVVKLNTVDSSITSVTIQNPDSTQTTIDASDVLSSAPITDLIRMIAPELPSEAITAAEKLTYRSLLTVNLMLDNKETFPDTWIYVHSPDVKVGRIQCFKNWSPDMVPSADVSSLGLEYFCDQNDDLWNTPNEKLIKMAKTEIAKLKLANPSAVFDAFVIRCAKTYPVYSMDYHDNLDAVKSHLAPYKNLQCIGRNGMFKYNNMDHSIMSGLLAADNILGADNDLWTINTDESYHEQSQQ